MPFCGSIPKGPLVCSGGIGHTAGALSAQVTWQENPHTCEEEKKQKDFMVICSAKAMIMMMTFIKESSLLLTNNSIASLNFATLRQTCKSMHSSSSCFYLL